MSTKSIKATRNPIIPGAGVCDPHMHVFNDRVYLYASHDTDPDQKTYHMKDWQIWSSDDYINWTLDQTVRPETLYMGASTNCWAVDAACKNNHYYYYFSNGNNQTGVAVSEHPAGPFVDALDKPLLDGSLTPTREYDPAVFIDDDQDQTPYIVFGGPDWAYGPEAGYFIARLGDNMISLAEKPKRLVVNHPADDKASLHKYNGIYYLTWASFYAVSSTIYGPYRYVGNFGASADHGSFFTRQGQHFNAFTIFDPSMVYRATGLCYVHYRASGEMAVDQMIVEQGVGHYDALWNKIEAEWYTAAHACDKLENQRQGFDVHPQQTSSWVSYPNISNLPEKARIFFFAACDLPSGADIEIRRDSQEGDLIGQVHVDQTRNMDYMGYRLFSGQLTNDFSEGSLYLVFKIQDVVSDGQHQGLKIDWFRFYP